MGKSMISENVATQIILLPAFTRRFDNDTKHRNVITDERIGLRSPSILVIYYD